jgi:hypothetical protein
MQKITVGVYKAYKNSGSFRFPRVKTKKHWKHYFIAIDEDDEDDYYFGSEWISALKAVVLKRKQLYKKTFYCTDCESVFTQYVKKNQNECDECPNGCE